MLYVADTTGQALAVALLLLVGDFAPALFGPLTGAVSDRFDLKRVMVGCDLIQAGLIGVLVLWQPSLPLLLVVVGLRALTGQIFAPASRSAVPRLVPDRGLEKANAKLGVGMNGAEALGPVLAAALYHLLGFRGVLLVDVATFLFSALLLARLPAMRARRDDGEKTTLVGDARAGLGYLWRTRTIRVIVVGTFAIVAFNGVDDVALVFLAKETLRSGDTSVGLLLSAVGIGLIVGYAVLARYASRLSLVVLLLAGFAVSSAGNLLTGLAWAVAAAFAVQAVRGVGLAAMDVATNTLVARIVPAELRGRVFGNLYAVIGIAAALAYVGGGVFLDLTDARTVLIAAGIGGIVATVATCLCLPPRRTLIPESPPGREAASPGA